MGRKAAEVLDATLRTTFAPVVREDGFWGTGRNFRRIRGDVIHLINIQGSRYGDRFFVNLAVHLAFLPDVLERPVDPRKIDYSECEFRRRMSENPSGQEWLHGNDSGSINRAVADMTAVYERSGRHQLRVLSNYPEDFALISPENLENQWEVILAGFGSTIPRMALAFARIRQHEGDFEQARRFAELGMAHLGMATGLRPKFRQFLDSPPNSR